MFLDTSCGETYLNRRDMLCGEKHPDCKSVYGEKMVSTCDCL
jgi:hypothetical protein